MEQEIFTEEIINKKELKEGLFFYDYISENCRDSKESPA